MRIVRINEACERLGVSRSTLYDMIKRGELRRPVKIGLRAAGLPDNEIEALIASRLAARDGIEPEAA